MSDSLLGGGPGVCCVSDVSVVAPALVSVDDGFGWKIESRWPYF